MCRGVLDEKLLYVAGVDVLRSQRNPRALQSVRDLRGLVSLDGDGRRCNRQERWWIRTFVRTKVLVEETNIGVNNCLARVEKIMVP